MSRYNSLSEIWYKADGEGGLEELIMNHGFSLDQLPEDTPLWLRDLFKEALELKEDLVPILREIDEALDIACQEEANGDESE